jgi:hypothetical protein
MIHKHIISIGLTFGSIYLCSTSLKEINKLNINKQLSKPLFILNFSVMTISGVIIGLIISNNINFLINV